MPERIRLALGVHKPLKTLVRMKRLELLRPLLPLEPKSSASANSATSAFGRETLSAYHRNVLSWFRFQKAQELLRIASQFRKCRDDVLIGIHDGVERN